MRSILPFVLAARLIASEPSTAIPVIELTYGGGGPAPAPAVAPIWEEARADAAAWWSQRTGSPLTAGDGACGNLHLVAATSLRPGFQPRTVVAGRWQGAGPALTTAWKAAAGRWPERTASVRDGDLLVESAGLPAPAPAAQPGWRLTVHGAGIASEAQSLLAASGDEAPLMAFVRALQVMPLRFVADFAPDGTGSATINLPPSILVPPDASTMARLPKDAPLAATLALDGPRILALPVPWDDLCKESACTREEAAAALSGSWSAVVYDEQRFLVAIPASPLALRLIGKPDPGITCEQWHGSLLISPDANLIAAWKRDPTDPADGGELGVVRVDFGRIAPFLHALGLDSAIDGIAAYLPLPERLAGNTGGLGAQISREMGFPGSRMPDAEGIEKAVEETGLQCLRLGRSPEGWLSIRLEGRMAPWLLPAAGLRWFADELQNQEGCVDLRSVIAQLHTDGVGALPADLLSDLPQLTDAELDAGISAWTALATSAPGKGDDPAEPSLAQTGLPAPSDFDPSLLLRARDLCARSAALPMTPAAAFDLLQARRRGRLGAFARPACQMAVRTVVRAGRQSALAGDITGVDASDRGVALAGIPIGVLGGLLGFSTAAMRDDAHLAAIMHGVETGDRLRTWLDERYAPLLPQAWRAERLLTVGRLADAWLESSGPLPAAANPPGTDSEEQMLASSTLACTQFTLAPHDHRAWTAGDLAKAYLLFRQLEHGGRPVPPAIPFRSPLMGMSLPAIWMMQTAEEKARARHALMRLGARLVLLGQAGRLPEDAPGLATALGGPVALSCGAATIPLVYERRGERGFRLAIDTAGDPPADHLRGPWRDWKRNKPRTGENRLAFPGSNPELTWDGNTRRDPPAKVQLGPPRPAER